MSEYKQIETRLWRGSRYDLEKVQSQICSNEHPGQEAHFAMGLIRTHGIWLGKNDGEDSAGRTKGAIMPPAEVAARAIDLTRELFAAMRAEGWLIKVGLPLEEVADNKSETG